MEKLAGKIFLSKYHIPDLSTFKMCMCCTLDGSRVHGISPVGKMLLMILKTRLSLEYLVLQLHTEQLLYRFSWLTNIKNYLKNFLKRYVALHCFSGYNWTSCYAKPDSAHNWYVLCITSLRQSPVSLLLRRHSAAVLVWIRRPLRQEPSHAHPCCAAEMCHFSGSRRWSNIR